MESRWNWETAQRIQTAILQELRQTLGVDAILPEAATKELMLQVSIIISLIHRYTACYIKDKLKHPFLDQNSYLQFQGLRQIQIGCKLQEAATNIKMKDSQESMSPVLGPTLSVSLIY